MKRAKTLLAALAILAVSHTVAQASSWAISVGAVGGSGGVGFSYYSGGVAYVPAPVYVVPQPVYCAPPQVYAVPPPAYVVAPRVVHVSPQVVTHRSWKRVHYVAAPPVRVTSRPVVVVAGCR